MVAIEDPRGINIRERRFYLTWSVDAQKSLDNLPKDVFHNYKSLNILFWMKVLLTMYWFSLII